MADNISTGILSGLYEKVYNPDVLSCLANLSNDEVFCCLPRKTQKVGNDGISRN